MIPVAFLVVLAATGPSPIEQAEALAHKAIAGAAAHPDASLADARKALALTTDFEPTAYVRAGRKGEVIEDAFVAARTEYRRHRSLLYEAVGVSLSAAGRQTEAARYLRRAFDLDPTAEGRAMALARSLVALGRGRPALDVLLAGRPGEWSAETLAVAGAAADAAGIPSLQAEIDRVRIAALPAQPRIEYRDGPIVLPERTRLSTGAPFRLDGDAPTFLYAADPSCRTCSADLETLKRVLPPTVQIVLVPPASDQDQGLRGVVSLYRYTWPYAVGTGIPAALGMTPPAGLLVARRGFVAAGLRPPFNASLPLAVEALTKTDVKEEVPRGAWNRRPIDRTPPGARPGLLDDGFAPGEDEPAPPEFAAALQAYKAGKPAEALRLFEVLEAKGDGWLLPPEARLDRALCLAAMGRGEQARQILLHTGDSRFQEGLDRSLEGLGAPAKKP